MSDKLMLKRQKAPSSETEEQQRSEVLCKAHQLCREYLQGGWAKVSIDDIEITPLGGGLTNKLYICKLPEKLTDPNSKCPGTVLLRVYGLILQDFKAQIQESVVFSILAERGVGPQLFAVFPGGRLEEYVPCRTLITTDLHQTNTSKYIAQCVADYHMLNMPVKKEPTYLASKMFSYLEKAKKTNFDDLKSHQLYKEVLEFDLDALAQFVTKMITKTDAAVVFCHNDIQEGNLLFTHRKERSNPVQMIDFEYSSYNYRGFDLANHFCEWMYDYSHGEWPFYSHEPSNYPTIVQQGAFIDCYLQSVYNHDSELRTDPKWSRDVVLEEVQRFAMMSHLFWALWSVVQAKMSDIGFGYLEYAITRLSDLKRQREKWEL